MSINRVVISGNLTRDPELRQTKGGSAILSIPMAVNDRRKNPQSGEWEDVPNYVDVTVFGNRANALANFLQKGSKVVVEGRLHYSSWEKDGQKRSKLDVTADEVEFMSRNNQQGGYQPQAQQAYKPQAAPMAQAPSYPQPTFDEQLPF